MNASKNRKGALARACALISAMSLAACGGGSDDPPPAMVAGADTATLSAGQTAALLNNDTIGGAAAVAGGNVSFSVTTNPLPAGITLNNGVLGVDASAAPGTHTIGYRICDSGHADNCASAAVTLTVPPPAVVATNDTVTVAANGSADLLANDTLGGAAASAATVSASATGTLPAGVTLSAAGLLSVASGATPGSYSIGYTICQTGVATNCASATIALTIPALGALSGRVVDEMTGAGIAGVRVSAAGRTTTTDAGGNFSLADVGAQSRVSVVFDEAGHARTARIAAVGAGAATDLQVRMLPVGTRASVDVASGGTVALAAGPARVVLPANAVQRADGSIPSGSMSVALTAIDPATNIAPMPGDFTTMQGGAAVPIESFGAIDVQLSDADGAALQLRSGQTATIRIPRASRNAVAPATIPLFWYDVASGRWVQEGTATLDGTGSYYEGTVMHFTTWNADQTYDTVNVSGCVADAAGNRLAGAFVQTDGVDYSGTTSAYTGSDGSFVLPMRRASLATLVGLSGGRLTNTLRIGAYTAGSTTLGECLVLGQSGAGVTMKLTWGQSPDDLDSHLYAPDGSHVWYSSKGALLAAPFANLDVDDTSSYGPEVVTLTRLMVGTYKYAVDNYSGQGSGTIGASGARVVLTIPGRAIDLYVPPATGETMATEWWNLFEMDVDASCNITVRRINSYTTSGPAAASTGGTPQYCTVP